MDKKNSLILMLVVNCVVSVVAFPVLASNEVQVTGKVNYEATIQIYPERRVPSSNNWQNRNTVEIRYPGTTTPIFTQVVETSSDGTGTLQPIDVSMLPPGSYDVAVKGYSHLRQVYRGKSFFSHQSVLDLTGEGTELIAGDTVSDNYINSLDMAYLVRNLYSTADIRGDLNRDGINNSLDVSNIVVNLYQKGED